VGQNESRPGPLGIVFNIIFALPFLGIGLVVAIGSFESGKWPGVPFGLIFAGAGAWQIVRVLRRSKSAEARAAALHTQSANLSDVIAQTAPINANYRTLARTNVTALHVYGPILPTSPVPQVQLQRGQSLPFALSFNDGSGSLIVQAIFGIVFMIPGLFVLAASFAEKFSIGGLFMGGIFFLVGFSLVLFAFKRRLARLKLPSVEVSHEPVFLGDPFQLHIGQQGPAKITRLRVDLICKEKATYTVGTSTKSEDAIVYEQELLDDPGQVLKNRERWPHDLTIVIPEGAPPSFKSKNNAIAWTVRVRAEILNWPDYDESYELRAFTKPPELR